jgi:hypothetical protein
MELGQVNQSHSHDLGHEIFLILQGQAEFEIEGEKRVLGPGQMCVALTDERHIVRNVGDEPVIMYLSVTPHIQPTHTLWQDDGAKAPPLFRPNNVYDVADQSTPVEELADRHLQASKAFAETVATTIKAQEEQVAAFKEALAHADKATALKARDAMWETLYLMYKKVYELAAAWNDFTARTADNDNKF